MPSDLRLNIFRLLIESYGDEKILAKEIGCTTSSLNKWKENESLPDKYMPKILILALKHRPDVKDFLRRELLEEVNRLCTDLNVVSGDGIEKGNLTKFMESLDYRSREIVWYFLRNRHAGIRELADLIHAPTDMDVLSRVKEVINPKAKDIFGKPLLVFKGSKIDSFTGDKVLFSWWLTEDFPWHEERNDMLDIFDERDQLMVITELFEVEEDDINVEVKGDILVISTNDNKYLRKAPLFYSVEDEVEKTYKNGVLEVRLKKKILQESKSGVSIHDN